MYGYRVSVAVAGVSLNKIYEGSKWWQVTSESRIRSALGTRDRDYERVLLDWRVLPYPSTSPSDYICTQRAGIQHNFMY